MNEVGAGQGVGLEIVIRVMQKDHAKRFLSRAAALVLMFAVVWQWTLVKHSGYLPKSNVTRHVHPAMKVEVGQLKMGAVRAALLPTARIVLTRPRFYVMQLSDPQVPPQEDAGLSLALQHRPPPSQRA
jgi:hypothetical protein